MIKDDMFKTRFKKPVKLEGAPAIVSLIIRLLLLEPGENQSHPEMGVGLVSKYRYAFEEDLKGLEDVIKDQIQTYIPMVRDVKINLKFADKTLFIPIEITGLMIKMNLKNDHLTLTDVTNI